MRLEGVEAVVWRVLKKLGQQRKLKHRDVHASNAVF
jgi:hypothetical protein